MTKSRHLVQVSSIAVVLSYDLTSVYGSLCMVIRDDQVLVTFRNRVLKFEVFLADHIYVKL